MSHIVVSNCSFPLSLDHPILPCISPHTFMYMVPIAKAKKEDLEVRVARMAKESAEAYPLVVSDGLYFCTGLYS